jgi:branched-chain amino acid transport system substrate-binding protein
MIRGAYIRIAMFRAAILRVAVVVVVAVGVVGAGVASAGPAAAASSSAQPLGPVHPASGSPVTVAVITDTGTGTMVEQGAKMGVAYLNRYAGGLAGHKVNLYVCGNKGTAAGGQACAAEVVRKGAVAVTVPFTDQGATEVPAIVHAGIPFITLTGASTAELTTPGAFAIEGGLPAELGAVALQSQQQHYKKVVLLVSNEASAVQSAQTLGLQVFQRAGVGVEVVPAAADAAAMKTQLRSAVSGGASAVGLLGDAALCRSFLQASNAVRGHLPRFVFASCLDPSIVHSSSLDHVLRGSWLAGASTATAKEDALYAAIVQKWAPGVSANAPGSANEAAGLVPILSLAALMKGYAGSTVNAAAVLHEAQSAQGIPIPLSGGQTFTCDGKAIPRLSSVCSSSAAVGVVGNGYAVSHVKVYDTSSLF